VHIRRFCDAPLLSPLASWVGASGGFAVTDLGDFAVTGGFAVTDSVSCFLPDTLKSDAMERRAKTKNQVCHGEAHSLSPRSP
jgi:hypothetical protein